VSVPAASPTLLLVVHGSAVAASAAATDATVAAIRARRPAIGLTVAYIENQAPLLADAVIDAVADAASAIPPSGPAAPRGPLVIVPFLLSAAFHVATDIAEAVAQARSHGRDVIAAPVIGGHPALLIAADELVGALPTEPTRIVLAAAGTSDESANDVIRDTARQIGLRRGMPVTAAFASAASPRLDDALIDTAVAEPGTGHTAVIPWVLGQGLWASRIETAASTAGAACTEFLGSSPRLVDVVWDRYDTGVAALGRPDATAP
jgi:sirohydrochlorin ferrochelatase